MTATETREMLRAVVTLYRDRNCTLWGIPYPMREDVEQSPRHLDDANRRAGWVCIPESRPASMPDDRWQEYLAYATRVHRFMPDNPCEWSYVEPRPEAFDAYHAHGMHRGRWGVLSSVYVTRREAVALFTHVDPDGVVRVYREGAASPVPAAH
jgi:hypothetical protein